ncbi:MAG: hypothetical protein J6Y92_05690 [Lentisphaeria bacterium]|nr:hypothetical protein [Lentisphaeria bacterium]
MPDNTSPAPLFTRAELKQFRYKCSHKLAVSLTVGAIYLLGVTAFFVNKAVHSAAGQNKLQYYGLAAAGYILIVGLVAMIVRRSQSLNFSRFLNGCVAFDKFEYMVEYVELGMPEPFAPRFLRYPVHLMILGKVLEHSEKPENMEVGHRMVAAAADRDPALEAFRGAELADLMKYHETFLSVRPEMVREWRNAESFHAMLVHLILPVVIIVGIVAFILKGCEPPELKEEDKSGAPAVEEVQRADAPPAMSAIIGNEVKQGPSDIAGNEAGENAAPADGNEAKEDAAPAAGNEANAPVTVPETVPQA